ncbi:hypothetical protein A3H80_03250 [Candidatus Roizmanbacteria bacterium RIFCSPLOWO2_02_FULL_37_19]|uniref:Uncharacterized protein n=1 Tax=Candidatus Roizmanbacteria bacterium RIFCSPHIGHO2_02_FULL_37_24 TaxID=1802037 RepID=A0A1F7GVL0_9BACT|nr:MAG: hypothetical protein A2862_03570 [Candidatus Roizmanbacteria bacterium RIFCSPHIGHO2_01_FULL_38_41]OGK23080.1 MAG: hypothetical protein A3C24_04705 [Candidatus Roizmanbacteria bacterium RIFCSPHIGHO2_02_FULL_37_24]OGK33871.1 MAG: hypothetical protein A3E10_01750 [Candidatus Roizmanbacteria bacterium RIFCSPHIGHO2_12_FULL_37_23]OGK45696.1 MAG: hypothetical protein A2956_01825 [Candidatus Roizmanbacteria bacterium RIFCSPLOWO2_01_FULL_37_57]OGK54107.1 MAG: hypothetical protein A3H80_03250 [Ca
MEPLLEFLDAQHLFSFFLKLFGVTLGLLYLFFAVIMIRQVISMKRTVSVKDGGILLIISYIQVSLATVIVFYALFIL